MGDQMHRTLGVRFDECQRMATRHSKRVVFVGERKPRIAHADSIERHGPKFTRERRDAIAPLVGAGFGRADFAAMDKDDRRACALNEKAGLDANYLCPFRRSQGLVHHRALTPDREIRTARD